MGRNNVKYRPYKKRLRFWPVFTIAIFVIIQLAVFALIFDQIGRAHV